jgi:hypothetical protein
MLCSRLDCGCYSLHDVVSRHFWILRLAVSGAPLTIDCTDIIIARLSHVDVNNVYVFP